MMGTSHQILFSDLVERIDAAWSILDICLVSYFVYYMWDNRKYVFSWWSNDAPLAIQAAAAILVFHTGDAVTRSILWWLRHEFNDGHNNFDSYLTVSWVTIILEFAAAFACIGIMCKIRVFANPWLGRWVWLLSATVAVVAVGVTRHLPF